MKTTILTPIILLLIVCSTYCQGLKPPSEGKAVIYFTRVSALGFAVGFEFFQGDKYIGAFAGKNYMRYECDPGQHLFWASAENKEFLTADVKAGDTYIVIVDVDMGIGSARVGLTPINSQDKVFERAKTLIDKKEPVSISPETVEKRNIKLADFIAEKLDKYETTWKNEKNFKHLSSDMAIPLTSF